MRTEQTELDLLLWIPEQTLESSIVNTTQRDKITAVQRESISITYIRGGFIDVAVNLYIKYVAFCGTFNCTKNFNDFTN